MIIKDLTQTSFQELMDCFNMAFENYFVPMPTDAEFFRQRWKRAKVSYKDSFGMFDGNQLVGFIIHAVDKRNGHHIAFNTGTGVLPEYRGQKMVQQLYDHAIPKLQGKGIHLCSLEVITENTKAVKAYERVGFSITKRYKCYAGTFKIKTEIPSFDLRKVETSHFNWNEQDQSSYSWDNHIATVSAGSFHYYVVYHADREVAYFVIDPERGYVAQFHVYEDTQVHWDCLFAGIQRISNAIRINNVDERLTSKMEYLKRIQLKNTVDQFEMEMPL